MPINLSIDIQKLKNEYVIKVNTKSGEVISNKYPDYTQRNILASNDQSLINNVWSWINSIRNLSNVTNESINNSTNSKTIYDIYQSFLTTIEGI